MIEGIESPYDLVGRRSIVAIHLKDRQRLTPFMQTFLYVQQASDIQGSVSMLLGTRFQSFRMGSPVYHVGVLPWWTRLTLWFMEVSVAGCGCGLDSGVPAGHLDAAMACATKPGRGLKMIAD